MYSTEHDTTGDGDVVHTTLKVADVEALRPYPVTANLTVTIGDVDLPAFVSDGKLYVQAPLPRVFEAFVESLPDFVRDMEVRVSTAGGATLPLDRNGRPVSRPTVALESLGRRSQKRRRAARQSGNAGGAL